MGERAHAGQTVVVFDAESDVSFARCVGATRDAKMQHMQATVVCALVLDAALCASPDDADAAMATATARHWWRDDDACGVNPFAPLLALFDDAAVIVAYNGLGFDFPLLRKHYGYGAAADERHAAHRLKCHDPMLRLSQIVNQMPKLNALLLANGLPTKLSDGLEAIDMWHAQERERLHAYCAEDVRLLAALTLLPTLRVPAVGTLSAEAIGLGAALAASAAAAAATAAAAGGARARVLQPPGPLAR